MKILYKLDSKGRYRQWNIAVVEKDGEFSIKTFDGIVGMKLKDPVFKKAVPNKLFKTSKEKAFAMMESAIKKKLRGNYVENILDAGKNDLFMPTGCPSGMIWEEWKDKPHVIYPALASAKLDGSKMYSTWRDGRVFLNTRSAKEHKNFKHIEEALETFYIDNPDLVLDGEAYNHEYAERFEDLQSIFRKQTPTDSQRELSKKVAKFYVYDVVDLNNLEMTAIDRQIELVRIFNTYFRDIDCLVLWASSIVTSEPGYDRFHEECLNNGFEGTVLKISDAPYLQRKNKNVMKRKPKFDCEFMITDVVEGTGTNKGIAAKVVIHLDTAVGINPEQHRMLASGRQDAGIAKGWNHKMLAEMLENKTDYIGKMATIEYGGMTAYGKLRFPKFKALRID